MRRKWGLVFTLAVLGGAALLVDAAVRGLCALIPRHGGLVCSAAGVLMAAIFRPGDKR